jgi:hypothetical protein
MMVAINPRPNLTPGRFIGIALVRHPRVQRAVVADSTARNEAWVGTAGSSDPGSITPARTSLIAPFVNGAVCDDAIPTAAGSERERPDDALNVAQEIFRILGRN